MGPAPYTAPISGHDHGLEARGATSEPRRLGCVFSHVGGEVSNRRPLSVLLADPDPLARRAVGEALHRAGTFVIAAEAGDGVDAVELAVHNRPDIALLELSLPRIDGVAATARIVRQAPEVRVVVFTASVDLELSFRALRAGACGYLPKDLEMSLLPRILEGVSQGEAAVTRAFAMRLIERLRELPEDLRGLRPVKSELTAREWEVLDLMSAGSSTREMAEELVLSQETVSSHVKGAMRKLGVHTRSEAVKAADALRRPKPRGMRS
jgi:DNA-binding NarL/FixJ family response regulator